MMNLKGLADLRGETMNDLGLFVDEEVGGKGLEEIGHSLDHFDICTLCHSDRDDRVKGCIDSCDVGCVHFSDVRYRWFDGRRGRSGCVRHSEGGHLAESCGVRIKSIGVCHISGDGEGDGVGVGRRACRSRFCGRRRDGLRRR